MQDLSSKVQRKPLCGERSASFHFHFAFKAKYATFRCRALTLTLRALRTTTNSATQHGGMKDERASLIDISSAATGHSARVRNPNIYIYIIFAPFYSNMASECASTLRTNFAQATTNFLVDSLEGHEGRYLVWMESGGWEIWT